MPLTDNTSSPSFKIPVFPAGELASILPSLDPLKANPNGSPSFLCMINEYTKWVSFPGP